MDHVGDGHAGALLALESGASRIAQGHEALCIVGGVDSYLQADTLDWLESELRIARPEVRGGMTPGEGAAVLALASDEARRHLRLPSLAVVRGAGGSHEPRPARSDEGQLGEALADAVRAATRGLSLPHEAITDFYGDINGERSRTEDWGFALLRTAECFRDGSAYVTALWHGGQGADDASPWLVSALGAPRRDSEKGDLSFLRISVPVSRFAADTGALLELVVRWSERLQPVYGYGGVTLLTSDDDGLAQTNEPKMAGLASRYPGLEIGDPLSHSLVGAERIKGGNWITILSEPFVEKLGGLPALTAQLGDPFRISPYAGGVTVAAGPAPEIGDWNQNVDTPTLRRLARVLAPIRVREHPAIHAYGKFSTSEGFEEWLTRFDCEPP